jgi:hypothetical protein
MPADFNHHAAKELEPLAVIYRQLPAAVALHVLSAVALHVLSAVYHKVTAGRLSIQHNSTL